MERFKNILVATSPGRLDPPALSAAVTLAHLNDARLTVMDVVAPLPPWRKTVNVEGRIVDLEAAILHDREERLRHLLDTTPGGPEVEVVESVGEPFIEVIQQILTDGHDLLMVGEPVAERPDEPHLSSGVMKLLRKCPVPVWVFRSGRSSPGRVLALVDPCPDDPVRDGLNDQIMDLATSLARRQNWELHLGHAWTLDGEATLRSSSYEGLPGEIVDIMVREAERIRLGQVEELANRYVSESERSVHMVEGAPGVALPRLVDRLDVDLVVMGTVGRTGLRGLIMGNTAETILRSVRCSVLAVKPEGFVTPVRIQRQPNRESGEP
jgi:nucleotide-binding universal stress UspA family protein